VRQRSAHHNLKKKHMATINFGGTMETVVTRKEFPMARARKVLKKEVIAIIGYGVQGPAQGLNLRDNGFKVIIGQAPEFKRDWDRAVADGWVPGKTLFPIAEAVKRATIIQLLVSDAAQRVVWPTIRANLKDGDALYFSHGFSIAYKKQTGVIPPKNVDVIMVAPKGSGLNVRRNFLTGAGINSSYAVEQDYTGRAEERCLAVGIGVGSGYLFPTTFEHEVFSDLTGERGVLMGALAGIMEAQYDVLRSHGHSPSEAFNETVEELTQSLIRLVDENGMDWMYSNCSATAQRGALDWKPKFRKAVLPVFKDLYNRVKTGKECARVLKACGGPNYQALLQKELSEIRDSEMWRAGKAVRELRPKELAKAIGKGVKGIGGRAAN
jgi:ketol-acid reductoisomerase